MSKGSSVYKLVTWKALDGWSWRMVAPNGRIVAESGEAYSRRSGCIKAVERLVEVIRDGFIFKNSVSETTFKVTLYTSKGTATTFKVPFYTSKGTA